MQLPNRVTPEWTTTLPISQKIVKFRPYLVKEERVLLTAMEAYDGSNIIILADAVRQILKNCVISTLDIDKLANVDMEWLFLEIRKKSVGDVVEVNFKHKCGEPNRCMVNLNTIKYVKPEGHTNAIALTETIGLTMKYPDFGSSLNVAGDMASRKSTDTLFDALINSIDKIYNGDEFEDASNFTKEQLREWVETFSPENLKSMLKFYETMPYLMTEVTYKCSGCGEDEKLEVRGAGDFFI